MKYFPAKGRQMKFAGWWGYKVSPFFCFGRPGNTELYFVGLRFFITLRSIQNDTLVIPSVCEESLLLLFGWRFFLPTVVRMTFLSSRTQVRDLMSYALLVGDSSLRLRCAQNDSCLLLLSCRKEVTQKGRPLAIGYSCFSLYSPTETAELAALKQSSAHLLSSPLLPAA